MSPQEREQVLRGWNGAAAEVPAETVPELFERQAAAAPGAVAVTDGGTALTYRQLNQRANQLAFELLA